MARSKAIIAGVTGTVGRPLAVYLSQHKDWDVVGLSRSPPDEQVCVHEQADFSDARSCRVAFGRHADATHVFYAARAPHDESGQEDIGANVALFDTVLDAALATLRGLIHVHLVEGGKYYGVHLGPYKTPAREDDPRVEPPNFYYGQEDLLIERQRGRSWTWSASRPNLIWAVSPGRPRSPASTIGAYAAICAARGVAMDFPGPEAAFTTLTEATDEHLMAEAMAWIASAPDCANNAFNVTNGDLFRWRHLWPRIATYFGTVPGDVRPMSVAEVMRDADSEWDGIVRQRGLRPMPLSQVAVWAYADFMFRQDYDVISDMNKARRHGFDKSIDSTEMIFAQFARYRAARILP